MKNCNCNTEIIRDGSGQLQRYLKALDPAYAPIDGRSTEDLLVFAKRYAAQIRFYDIPGSKIIDNTPAPKVSWREFFRRDMAVIAASIAVTVAESFKKEYDEVNQRLQYNTTPDVYAALYAPIVGMLKKIDKWYTIAIPENPLYADLKLAIESDLKMQVQKIMAYEEGFKFVDPSVDLQIDLDNLENKEVWGVNETVPPDPGIYKGTSLQEKILSASLFTEDIFHAFYNFLNRLISHSEKYLLFALEEYPAHQPHMALFITFLQLFNKAQQQMNGLTGRLLDFYYKEVLHLQTKPSMPDKAHIVFELAKDVTEYGITTGTALKAGPDISGIEQLYKTTDDLVINQAKVKELKTIFIEKEESRSVNYIKSIYAMPIANSADGYGLPFETNAHKWPTFGKGSPSADPSKNICQRIEKAAEILNSKNEARIGFAVVSPQLVLQGGNRIIALQMAALQRFDTKKLEIQLTAEEGWLKIDKEISDKNGIIKTLHEEGGDLSKGMPEESGYFIDLKSGILYICLPVSEKAIIPFDLQLHPGKTYPAPYPVMQVLMGPDINFDPIEFNKITINDLSLSIRVGSNNLPEKVSDIALKGKVIDSDTQQPLAGVKISVFPNSGNAVTTDANGEFSIGTATTNTLAFSFTGYKPRLISVTNINPVIIRMEQGDEKDTDTSGLIIPSFFDGLKNLTLQNDDGIIQPNKPFDPFTAYPKPGSALYIGSDEIFNKPVDELSIHIKHLSDSTDAIFDMNFPAFTTANSRSKISDFFKLSVREQRQWTLLCTPQGRNFMEGALTRDVLFKKSNDGKPAHLPPLKRTPLSYASEFETQTVKGFIQLQNNLPPNIVDIGKKEDDTTKDVFQQMALLANIVKVKEISLSYFSRLQKLEPEIDQFFHVYPFGIVEIYSKPVNPKENRNILEAMLKNRANAYTNFKLSVNNFKQLDVSKDYLLVNARQLLLPQFTYLSPYAQYAKDSGESKNNGINPRTGDADMKKETGDEIAERLILSASDWKSKIEGGDNQYSAKVQEEGMLFIGLENAMPLQMVSMLFQFAEGSAADEDNDPPEIHWSYLTNNEWRPLKDESIVSDGTVGFQTTGIIKIEIPQDATSNNTIITSGLYWLCASVTTNSNRIPMLIDIVTQAVLASFEDNNNDQSHFDKALAAGSISKLSVAVAEVGKVQQPFASFDGKHKEIGKEFYTRVSERLRHKARAITAWDYEHLVLNRFPSVYKVKCITHTDPNCLCREPEKRAPVAPAPVIPIPEPDPVLPPPPPPAEATTCGIGKVDLKFIPGKIDLDDESEEKLKQVVSKMRAGIKCKIIIIGFFTKGDEKSKKLNIERVGEQVARLIKRDIDKSRIETVFHETGEQNMIMLSDEKSEMDVLNDMSTPYDNKEVCCGPQIAPGHVLLVPISNLKNRNSINPLQPKTSRRVLLDIEAYMQKRTSPFVRVHAKNPVYEQVLVFFRVKFREGYDKGFHMKKLNDEIVHYLTPWAFDDIIEVKFGQKIYASSIINFIEERIYVDFITDFLMIVCRSGCCDNIVDAVHNSEDDTEVLNKISGCNDMEILNEDQAEFPGDIVAKPSTARSILVSAPRHIIIPYQEPETLSPCEKLELKKAGTGILIKNENIKRLTGKTDVGLTKVKPLTVVKERRVEERKPTPTAEVKPEHKDVVEEKKEATHVTKPEKKMIPAPAVTDAIKSTAAKTVKKPIAKKQPVKTAKKNEKAPDKK